MIPKFDNFFLPCLQCLNDENIHSQESLRNYVINYFKLTAAEAGTLIKSGKKTQVSDRVSWTVSYFLQAGFVDSPKRGTYRINEFGKSFLLAHKDGFDKTDLLQIPSFAKFATRRTDKPENNIKKSLVVEEKNRR